MLSKLTETDRRAGGQADGAHALVHAGESGRPVALDLERIDVLLLEDDAGYSQLVREFLRSCETTQFAVTGVSQLSEGLALLSDRPVDVVLLDLGLPDSGGLRTLERMRAQAANVAVVVLTGAADERLALEALHHGAQDYLIKTETDGERLVRSILYAIERQRLLDTLESLSLLDQLTGLYNRRGFFTLAERHLAHCRRQRKPVVLMLADLDNLKDVNDRHGHQEGDRVIAFAGQCLKRVSRKADVVGRIGGDEFAALLADAGRSSTSKVQARLQEGFRVYNRRSSRPYRIAMSVGVACQDANGGQSLEGLMAEADTQMYRHKRRNRASAAARR